MKLPRSALSLFVSAIVVLFLGGFVAQNLAIAGLIGRTGAAFFSPQVWLAAFLVAVLFKRTLPALVACIGAAALIEWLTAVGPRSRRLGESAAFDLDAFTAATFSVAIAVWLVTLIATAVAKRSPREQDITDTP
jgi:hypothetical protein